jgi:hypothetical protein
MYLEIVVTAKAGPSVFTHLANRQAPAFGGATIYSEHP